jgi:hypothetical protein
MDPASIEALTFDVFGTVVDWRSSIIREGEALGRAKNLGHATPQAGALDGATVGEMVAPRPCAMRASSADPVRPRRTDQKRGQSPG